MPPENYTEREQEAKKRMEIGGVRRGQSRAGISSATQQMQTLQNRVAWNEIRQEKGRFFRWLGETGQCCSTIGSVVKELQSLHRTVDQIIDDLIRTGFISKEQHWRENSGRSCLLFFT